MENRRSAGGVRIDRRIFSYWHQGFKNAPPVVQLCSRSLQRHHNFWDIHLLDADSVNEWLEPIPIPEHQWRRLPLPHQSDVIRSQLLVRYGGVWADPTIYFSRPLDDWLGNVLDSGLFLFHRPGRDRLISNWFIASLRGNTLLHRLYESLCLYWAENDFDSIGFPTRRPVELVSRVLHRNVTWPQLWLSKPFIRLFRHAPYMIYHYLFARVVSRDSECADIWRRTPKVPADGPHRLLRHGLRERFTPQIAGVLDGGEPPLFKLNWKTDGEDLPRDSVLAELFRQIDQWAGGQPCTGQGRLP